MSKQISSEIRYRKMKVRQCARLAADYAKDKNYEKAAVWYTAAHFHGTVALALQPAARDSKRGSR